MARKRNTEGENRLPPAKGGDVLDLPREVTRWAVRIFRISCSLASSSCRAKAKALATQPQPCLPARARIHGRPGNCAVRQRFLPLAPAMPHVLQRREGAGMRGNPPGLN